MYQNSTAALAYAKFGCDQSDGSVQERCNSSALAMELCLLHKPIKMDMRENATKLYNWDLRNIPTQVSQGSNYDQIS